MCGIYSSSFGAGTHGAAGPLPVDFCSDRLGHAVKVMDVASQGLSWLPGMQKKTTRQLKHEKRFLLACILGSLIAIDWKAGDLYHYNYED